MEGSPPPLCDHCNVSFTIEHIFTQCEKYRQLRIKYNFRNNLIDILNESVNVPRLMSFLKEAYLFYLI